MVSQSLTIFFSACLITGSLHRARAFSTPAFRLGHCGSASITPVSLTRASSRTAGRQRRCYVGVALAADESGDGEPTLYTGSDAEAKLEELRSMYPADEADYLAASRKRNEEAKRKLLEETAREEAEAEEKIFDTKIWPDIWPKMLRKFGPRFFSSEQAARAVELGSWRRNKRTYQGNESWLK